MLFRLVRPVRRSDSRIPYFVQRIPADVKARAVGVKLDLPIGEETVPVTITEKTSMLRDAGIGEELHDALTGHSGGGVGRSYGGGFGLKALATAISKIPAPSAAQGPIWSQRKSADPKCG